MPEKGSDQGRAEVHAGGRAAAWQLGAGADANDRSGGKRTNWLLIKHRDEYAREGDDEAFWTKIARSRPAARWTEIAAGKGKAPKPFMTGSGRAKADAVWQSNRGDGSGRRAHAKKAGRRRKGGESRRNAGFRRAAALHSWSNGRRRRGLGARDQVRRLSHAAARRGRQGDAARPARASTGPTNSRRSPRPAAALPDGIIDGEVVALDHDGAPDFAALQAALSDGKTDDLIFFVFDLLFAEGEDLRALPLSERKSG